MVEGGIPRSGFHVSAVLAHGVLRQYYGFGIEVPNFMRDGADLSFPGCRHNLVKRCSPCRKEGGELDLQAST